MMIDDVLGNKELKPKEKTERIAQFMLTGDLKLDDMKAFFTKAKDPAKATCMEALEYVTRVKPEISDGCYLVFSTEHLGAKAPRLKWEAAKVIGNIAHLYPDQLERTIEALKKNACNDGTVVRWSAAYALSQIFLIPAYSQNDTFRTELQGIMGREEKDSINKIYSKVLNSKRK